MSTGGVDRIPTRMAALQNTAARSRPLAGIGDFSSRLTGVVASGRSPISSAKSELAWTGHSQISNGDVDKNPTERPLSKNAAACSRPEAEVAIAKKRTPNLD